MAEVDGSDHEYLGFLGMPTFKKLASLKIRNELPLPSVIYHLSSLLPKLPQLNPRK